MGAVDLGPWLRAQTSGATPPRPITLPSLRIDGTVWRDRDTLWVPRMVSYLSALRKSRSESDWHTYFQWAVRTGFNGVRTFGGFREDQDPYDALKKLPRYLAVATEYGLVVEFTALTGTADHDYDPEAYIRDSAAIIRPYRGHVILEEANEYEHGSQNLDEHDLVDWGRAYCDGLCWAVGAPPVDEPDPDGFYPGAGGTYCTAHLDRGRDFWNQCRRVREIFEVSQSQGVPCLDNEPLGADEVDGSVSEKQRSNDPAFFATLGALDRGFPGVGGVHHSQAGLDAVLPGPIQQQCATAYVSAQMAVAGLLGPNIPLYKNSGPGHVDSPVIHNGDAVRVYSFTLGNVAASVGVGVGDASSIHWGNGWQIQKAVYAITAHDWLGRQLIVWDVRR